MQPDVSTETNNEDGLIASGFPLRTTSVVVSTGQNLTRGAVLGRKDADGQYILSDSGAADGSEAIRAILAEDVDATAADKTAVAYLTGTFNQHKLTFGPGHDPATVATQNAMADRNLYLVDSLQA